VGIMDYISYKSDKVHLYNWSPFSFVDEKYTKHSEEKKNDSKRDED
jgi:hypothetical protein